MFRLAPNLATLVELLNALTFTLCMLMMFPQSSMYCFRSLSCTEDLQVRQEEHTMHRAEDYKSQG